MLPLNWTYLPAKGRSTSRLTAVTRVRRAARWPMGPVAFSARSPWIDAVTVRARALVGESWSPLREIAYRRADQQSDVRITEVMYNPLDGERYEFLELTNLGRLPADLSGAFFEGIDFYFPWYRTLAPGESVAIVADFKRFRERYPEAEIGGVFGGKLSDRGERIVLIDRHGVLLDAVAYEDGDGWPLSADGTGDSIVLLHADGDPNNPINWRASEQLDGSPGEHR